MLTFANSLIEQIILNICNIGVNEYLQSPIQRLIHIFRLQWASREASAFIIQIEFERAHLFLATLKVTRSIPIIA